MKLGAVHGEVDVGRLVYVALLPRLGLRAYKGHERLAPAAQQVVVAVEAVAAAAEVLVDGDVVVRQLCAQRHGGAVGQALRPAVGPAHHRSALGEAAAVAALEHDVLAAAVDDNLWHGLAACGTGEHGGVDKARVGRQVERVEVERHVEHYETAAAAHAETVETYAAGGHPCRLRGRRCGCHGGCHRRHEYTADDCFHLLVLCLSVRKCRAQRGLPWWGRSSWCAIASPSRRTRHTNTCRTLCSRSPGPPRLPRSSGATAATGSLR